MTRKYELITAFSAFTTKRLAAIRKALGKNLDFKKKDVSASHVAEFFEGLNNEGLDDIV